MLNRIKDSLCHPSRLGLYYKDSLLKIIITIIIFGLAFVGLSLVMMMNTDYFDSSSAKSVSSDLISDKNESTIVFKDNAIVGDSYTYTGDDYIISFLDDEFKPKDDFISISFKANSINVYYHTELISIISYDEIKIKDFSISELKNGSMADRLALESLIKIALDSMEYTYALEVFLENMAMVIGMYLVLAVVCVVMAYFINPEINMSYRIRLALYDTIIYFVIMIFSLMFSLYWLQYVALLLPLIYVKITFSHIVKVKIKRNGVQ